MDQGALAEDCVLMIKGRYLRCSNVTEAKGYEEKNLPCSTEGCDGTVFGKSDNVKELPVGEYDAVRTLRHNLQQAERGEIDQVIVLCRNVDANDGVTLWAAWSDMTRYEVLWLQRWFNSWLNKRYFFDYHEDDEGEDS